MSHLCLFPALTLPLSLALSAVSSSSALSRPGSGFVLSWCPSLEFPDGLARVSASLPFCARPPPPLLLAAGAVGGKGESEPERLGPQVGGSSGSASRISSSSLCRRALARPERAVDDWAPTEDQKLWLTASLITCPFSPSPAPTPPLTLRWGRGVTLHLLPVPHRHQEALGAGEVHPLAWLCSEMRPLQGAEEGIADEVRKESPGCGTLSGFSFHLLEK